MGMEASEVAVRVRLLGGTAFEREAQGVAKSVEEVGVAGGKANLGNTLGGGAEVAGKRVKTLGDHIGNLGRKLQGIGMGLAPVSAGLAYLGYNAVKAQSQFQGSMMQLVTQANLPRKNLQGLTKDVLALSTAVGQTPQALSGGLFNIVSSGVKSARQQMALLKTTGIMASVGGDTVQSSSNALMSMFNTHLPGGGSPMQLAAYIEAAIGQGKVHMDAINGSMTTGILPMVKRSGMTIPDLLASMAALSREGTPPEQFASRMRLTLTSVMSPTQAALKAFKTLHLNPGDLAGDLKKPGHLLTMLDDLQMHASRLKGGARGALANSLIAQIFGKSRGMGNIAGLLDTLPQMQKIYGAVAGANPNILASHFNETKTTDQFKLQQAKAAWDKALISLGSTIDKYVLPDLTKLVLWLSKLITGFSHLSPGLQKMAVLLGGALVILAPLLIALGGLFRAVSGGIGIVKTAVGWIKMLGGSSEAAAGESGLLGFGRGLARAVPLLFALGAAMAALPAVIKAVTHQYDLDKHAIQNKPGARSRLLQNTMQNQWHGGNFGQINARSVPSKVLHFFTGIFGGQAAGGITHRPGLSVVGENGPELMSMPLGAQVTPLPGNALSDIKAQFGDGAGDIHITVNSVLDSKVLATTVATVNRKQQNRK